jgi:hypothetical protein
MRVRVAEFGHEAFLGVPITDIRIPPDIRTVGANCLGGRHLRRGTIPRELRGCPIAELLITASVEALGMAVFQECRHNVTFPGDSHSPSIGGDRFRNLMHSESRDLQVFDSDI